VFYILIRGKKSPKPRDPFDRPLKRGREAFRARGKRRGPIRGSPPLLEGGAFFVGREGERKRRGSLAVRTARIIPIILPGRRYPWEIITIYTFYTRKGSLVLIEGGKKETSASLPL